MKLTLVSRVGVPPGGFVWRQYQRMTKPDWGAEEPANFLVAADPDTAWAAPPRDLLEECPGLFLEFGALECSEAEIAAFASKYGLLGIPKASWDPKAGGADDEAGKYSQGELLADWTRSIRDVAGLLKAWDALRAGDLGQVGAWLASMGSHPLEQALGEFGSDLLRSGRMDGLRLVDWSQVVAWKASRRRRPRIGEEDTRLQGWETLLGEVEGPLFWSGRINVRVDRRAGSAAPELLGICDGIEVVVWLQFADAIARNRRFEACGNRDQGCRSWVPVDPRHPDGRRYCSTKCRMSAHYRMRKDRGRRKGETGDGQAEGEG